MNIIIPMAGRGSRMRPHTLTIPKPLLPIAGKPIVERLVENLNEIIDEPIEQIGFVIGRDFGKDVEAFLQDLAKKYNAKGRIFYQDSPEGIAHALLCGGEVIQGKTIVALADTLFVTKNAIQTKEDGVIFVQKVKDPSAFGVVTLDKKGVISALVEKPKEFVSDQAIVGIYYFKDGDKLKEKMNYLLENDIRTKGEYQLTDAIELLRKDGAKLKVQEIDEWLDCGTKKTIVQTNKRVLDHKAKQINGHEKVKLKNSVIIKPCYIAPDVVIENSVIGPHVSIGEGSVVKNSVVKNTIIQSNTKLENKVLKNSMIGNHVKIKGTVDSISVGDYSFNEL